MNTFKELLESIDSVKLGEYAALSFAQYITAQIEDTEKERGTAFLSTMDAFYIGYVMGNLPVLITCKENISDEMINTNEVIRKFEDIMTRHGLWEDFDECIKFTKTQI